MNIDHLVLWVSDQKRSLDLFVNVVGLGPVRAQEFAEGGAWETRRTAVYRPPSAPPITPSVTPPTPLNPRPAN